MSIRELSVLVAMSMVWGFHFVVIKTAVASVPPLFYASLRMALVAMLLAPFLRWRKGMMAPVLGAGLCFGALNYAFLFTGLYYAPASAAAIAAELYTPFATIMSVIFLGETVGWKRISGIVLAFAGVAIIALGREGGGAYLGVGVGLVAMGTIMEAAGSILVKQAKGFRPHELLAWFALIGALVLPVFTAIFESGQREAFAAADKWMLAGAIIYSAVGSSIFGHTAYYWLLQRLPVSQVAPSALLTTLFAVTFSVLFLGDPLTVRFIIGGVLALAGVGIILLRTPKGRIVEPGAPEQVVVAVPEETPTQR